jgi:hypothetical protein
VIDHALYANQDFHGGSNDKSAPQRQGAAEDSRPTIAGGGANMCHGAVD